MDDYGSIKNTPQNPYLGLLSGGVNSLSNGMSGAGMGWFADGMGLPAAGRVLEDMSYGSPPYRGTGMATRLSPDAAAATGAAINMGGFMPIGGVNRLFSGIAAIPFVENQSLDSVIQDLLNRQVKR